jgi:hypothetical protein
VVHVQAVYATLQWTAIDGQHAKCTSKVGRSGEKGGQDASAAADGRGSPRLRNSTAALQFKRLAWYYQMVQRQLASLWAVTIPLSPAPTPPSITGAITSCPIPLPLTTTPHATPAPTRLWQSARLPDCHAATLPHRQTHLVSIRGRVANVADAAAVTPDFDRASAVPACQGVPRQRHQRRHRLVVARQRVLCTQGNNDKVTRHAMKVTQPNRPRTTAWGVLGPQAKRREIMQTRDGRVPHDGQDATSLSATQRMSSSDLQQQQQQQQQQHNVPQAWRPASRCAQCCRASRWR